MSINYNVVARVNPLKREETPKFYATFNSKGKRNLRYIAQRISDKSTLNIIDVKAVLEGLLQVIPEEINDGYIVELEEFGNFGVTCSSSPSATEEEVTASNIEKVNLQFRPGKLIKNVLENAEFKREVISKQVTPVPAE
jgi:predicted histone-like DNA-binding protein